MTRVSLIVPVYNSARYLERCIDSLLAQEYEDTEIILVNDGSTDSSGAICERYAGQYPEKVRVISQDNQGASLARKAGIEAARGEYLIFADSDDYFSPFYVSALLDACMRLGTPVSLCPMKRLEVGETPMFEKPKSPALMPKNELMRRFFKYEFWGFGGGCYAKYLFDSLLYPIATVNEDYYVKTQMFAGLDGVGYVDTPLYIYEQHPGSLSKQPLSLRALGEFDNALATFEFIKTNDPRYATRALAIAAEAASKWLGALNRNTDPKYDPYRHRIRHFLRQNLPAILLTPHLLWKIKPVIMYNLLKGVLR